MTRKKITPRALAPNEQTIIDQAYLTVLSWQCRAFIEAINRVNASIEDLNKAPDNNKAGEQVFSDVQSAILFAANISQILWPARPRYKVIQISKPRGQRMRQLLGITHSKHLQDVRLRDNLAHLDEKIDAWTQRPNLQLGIHLVARENDIATLHRDERLTWLNPQTLEVSMFANKMNLQDLMDEVVAIAVATSQAIRNIQSPQSPAAPPQESM